MMCSQSHPILMFRMTLSFLNETSGVLGIDPGLAQFGWGLVDSDGNRHKHIDHGLIETQSDQLPERRLLIIHRGIIQFGYRPTNL